MVIVRSTLQATTYLEQGCDLLPVGVCCAGPVPTPAEGGVLYSRTLNTCWGLRVPQSPITQRVPGEAEDLRPAELELEPCLGPGSFPQPG